MRRGLPRQLGARLGAALATAVALFAVTLISPPAAHADVDDLDAEELTAIRLLNEAREDAGLSTLSLSPILTEAAEWMSDDLADRGFLDHVDSRGRGLGPRVHSFGYPTNAYIRENIALGYPDGRAVMDGWMNSPGHRANNLAGDVVAAGIARTLSDSGVWFWTLVLGSHEDQGTIDPPSTPTPTPEPTGTPPVGTGTGTFQGSFPPRGIGLNVWNGGSIEQLAAGAAQGGAQSVFISADGELIGYVIGAPTFVNTRFVAQFPGATIPAGTGVVIVMR